MSTGEILPLLLCADAVLVVNILAVLGSLLHRFHRPSRAGHPISRPAYSPAARFLPCHRLSIGIPRA